MQQFSNETHPVAVLGAGPVGLASAAHLIERGLPVIVLEAGPTVASHLESFRHVRLFSPWKYNLDAAAVRFLTATKWVLPDDEALPTAGQMIDEYLLPLSQVSVLAKALRLETKVVAVTRDGMDKVKTNGREQAPLVVRVTTPTGLQEYRARAVIDATGTWSQPNPLGGQGLPAWGEVEFARHIRHGMPDILGREIQRYRNKTTLVVGSGHSAAGNLIALATLADQSRKTKIVWAVRGTDTSKVFGDDELPARGALGAQLRRLVADGRLEVRTGFSVQSLSRRVGKLSVVASNRSLQPIDGLDEIIGSTGSRPNLEITREIRTRHDAWLESSELLAPLIDPNLHSCGTVPPHGHRQLAHPEASFYAVGAKSYGRAPNFLLATGYEQVRSIAAALAGDLVAADDVQLSLPATGVCSSTKGADQASAGCCGGAPKSNANACCALDEQKKSEGEAGCGCAQAKSALAPAGASSACCG